MTRHAQDAPGPSPEPSGGRDTAGEPTQPLPKIASLVFAGYLARHQLSILDVALAARVRLLTIWRVLHDEPISEQQAQQVYAGLLHLTGVRYRGRIRQHTVEDEARGSGFAPSGPGQRRSG